MGKTIFFSLVVAIRRCADIFIMIFFSYMVLAVIVQIIGRYIFNFSIAWASETATFSQIAMVMLGAGYAMRHNLHVGLDIFTEYLSPRINSIIQIIVTLFALWFLWVIINGSFKLLEIGQFQRSPALQMKMFYPYLMLPIGAGYLAFEVIMVQFSKIKNIKG